jgi:hypothetical protein
MADVFSRFIAASIAVNRVQQSQGLKLTADVAGSNDETAKLMWALLREVGQDLLDKAEWQRLVRTHTITTVAGTEEYDLPDDFESFIGETGWNETTEFMLRPVNNQEWRLLKARQVNQGILTLKYRINGDQVVFHEVPDTAQSLKIEYMSRGWLTKSDDSERYDTPQANSDIILYPPRLIVAALTLMFRRRKGFDTADAAAEMRMALETARNNNKPMRNLPIGGGFGGFQPIGAGNLPETGLGS